MENSKSYSEHRAEANIRDIIDSKLSELESRRDKNLQAKVDAIEKLTNLVFLTKSEALGIAISRMQGDSKECLNRCTTQVEKFYALIHKINNDNVGRDIHIQTIMDAVTSINKIMEDLEKHHDTDLDSMERDSKISADKIEEKYLALEKKYDEFEIWKSSFWVKNITTSVVVTVFISQVLFQGFSWVVDYLSKVAKP